MRGGLVALVASLVACDAALGIEDLKRSTGPEPIAYAAAQCAACATQSCAAARARCSSDDACDGLQRCGARCPPNDARCRMLCERAAPIAATGEPFRALDFCLRGSCTEPCLGVAGLGGVFGPECACLDDPCAAETLACLRAGTPERPGACERGLSCIAQSGLDPDHAQECLLGTQLNSEVNDLRRCWSTTSCPSCPFSKSGALECVGRYRWQLPSKPKIRFDMNVTSFDNARNPVPGITVHACNAGSCANCTAPIVSDVTDEKGNITLELPTGVTGFGGCLTLSKPGLVPMIVHPGFPLVRDITFGMFVVEAVNLPVLGKLLGTDTMADRGHLISIAADCVNSPIAGMRVEVEPTDSSVRSGRFINNTLDTMVQETGSLGTTLFVNLPPRATPPSLVSASHAGRLISRNYAVIVPGTLTVLFSVPRTSD